MSETAVYQPTQSKVGEPVWELATEYPYQGEWTEAAYLSLTTNRLIEYNNGFLEFLPMPTYTHQLIVLYIYELLKRFVHNNALGNVITAPLRIRLWGNTYREPDVLFLSTERIDRMIGDYPDGADLVVEVVSGSRKDRQRDLIIKREEYAEARIPEYWIVDPVERQITVLHLDGERYAVHHVFEDGEQAESVLLKGFEVGVTAVFNTAKNN